MLSAKLLSLLVCPVCKESVQPLCDGSALACRACGLAFPVREGIPVMLASEAVRLDEVQAGPLR